MEAAASQVPRLLKGRLPGDPHGRQRGHGGGEGIFPVSSGSCKSPCKGAGHAAGPGHPGHQGAAAPDPGCPSSVCHHVHLTGHRHSASKPPGRCHGGLCPVDPPVRLGHIHTLFAGRQPRRKGDFRHIAPQDVHPDLPDEPLRHLPAEGGSARPHRVQDHRDPPFVGPLSGADHGLQLPPGGGAHVEDKGAGRGRDLPRLFRMGEAPMARRILAQSLAVT